MLLKLAGYLTELKQKRTRSYCYDETLFFWTMKFHYKNEFKKTRLFDVTFNLSLSRSGRRLKAWNIRNKTAGKPNE